MDEPVDMARGVPQSYFVDEFASEGIMLEGIAGPPDYVAMGLPVAGERHRELMAGYQEMAQFGLMISDDSRGRVHSLAGRPIVRYDLSDTDTARVRTGLEKLAELFWAAGAQRVLLPLARKPELRPGEAIPDLRPRDLKLMAFHPLGTARMDARGPRHGVLDAHGRVHGTEGVYVCDGSAVPSSLGVNPQITIMTLATRLARSPMSFLIDGPWLYANGRAIARTDHPTELAAGTMAVFWGVSIPLYLNRRWTRPIWRACRASSGRDWMINSGVLKVDADTVSARGHALSAAIFATYPLWLWLGLRHGKR